MTALGLLDQDELQKEHFPKEVVTHSGVFVRRQVPKIIRSVRYNKKSKPDDHFRFELTQQTARTGMSRCW